MGEIDDASEYLRGLGNAGDGPHDIALAALMLASLDRQSHLVESSKGHLDAISDAARAEAPLMTSTRDAAHVLSHILAGRFGYDGDRLTYDDPQNADLIRVIARRRGLPVALGILYMHAARAAGLKASGLNTPAHFLVLLTRGDSEVLIDPFNGGALLDAERLGTPLRMGGHESVSLIETVSDTDVLLRLQENLKLRALQTGERSRAQEIARRMVLIAPRKPELWLDLARLNELLGVLGAARQAYEACLKVAGPGQSLHNEAALGLAGLKRLIN
jgi:regulator of sirC expression with transglutaminase-like and TPR domain